MPGFIEAHAHIGISEEKWGVIADDCNEGTNPVTPSLRAIDALNPMDPAFHEAIEAGITSVMTGPGSANVVGGQFVFLKTQGRWVDHMVVKYPVAMKVAFGENPKTAYGDQGISHYYGSSRNHDLISSALCRIGSKTWTAYGSFYEDLIYYY